MGALATWGSAGSLAAACVAGLLGRSLVASRLHRAGAVLAAVAVALLAWALVDGDLTLAYVAEHTRRGASWPFRLAALWGAMAGSLLLWAALLAAWGARRGAGPLERAAASGLAAAFVSVVALFASPWGRLPAPAIDGLGLVPILEHPAMLYHPPILYLGLTGLALPWAGAVGGVAGPALRRRLLACLALLTAGMVAGAHWAYAELGWGGYWAWDPVENTALLPWLAVLAALHLLRRGAARAASAAAAGALVLALVGTTITRSGAAPSVHAFAEDAAVGRALLAVTAVVAAVSAVAVLRRRDRPPPQPRTRRARLLRVQPWLAGAALLVVLIGTLRPLVGADAVAVGGSYFARFTAPLAVAAVVLLVVAGQARHLAHVGFVVLLVGIAGTATGTTRADTLLPGGTLDVGGWTVRNDGVEVVEIRDQAAVEATVTLLRGDRVVAVLRPARVAYPERGLELAETAIRSSPLVDVQVVLHSAADDGRALVEVHVRPLLQLVWWGGLLLAAAALRQATAPTAASHSDTSSSSSSVDSTA